MEHQQTWFDANAGWIGFVSLVVGIVALVTGFLFYWWSRRPKRFGWQLMSQTPILTADAKGLPLKILYAGEHEVSKPNLVIVRFGNRGKVELRSEDYDRPVTLRFDEAKLIGATLIDGLRLDVDAELTREGNSVSFVPPMLNKGEWVDLQFVTDGPLEVPTVKARIAGQSGNTDELTHAVRKRIRKVFLGAIVMTIALFLLTMVLSFSNTPVYIFVPYSLLILIVIGFTVIMMTGSRLDYNPVWSKQSIEVKSPKPGNAIMRAYQGARKWVE